MACRLRGFSPLQVLAAEECFAVGRVADCARLLAPVASHYAAEGWPLLLSRVVQVRWTMEVGGGARLGFVHVPPPAASCATLPQRQRDCALLLGDGLGTLRTAVALLSPMLHSKRVRADAVFAAARLLLRHGSVLDADGLAVLGIDCGSAGGEPRPLPITVPAAASSPASAAAYARALTAASPDAPGAVADPALYVGDAPIVSAVVSVCCTAAAERGSRVLVCVALLSSLPLAVVLDRVELDFAAVGGDAAMALNAAAAAQRGGSGAGPFGPGTADPLAVAEAFRRVFVHGGAAGKAAAPTDLTLRPGVALTLTYDVDLPTPGAAPPADAVQHSAAAATAAVRAALAAAGDGRDPSSASTSATHLPAPTLGCSDPVSMAGVGGQPPLPAPQAATLAAQDAPLPPPLDATFFCSAVRLHWSGGVPGGVPAAPPRAALVLATEPTTLRSWGPATDLAGRSAPVAGGGSGVAHPQRRRKASLLAAAVDAAAPGSLASLSGSTAWGVPAQAALPPVVAALVQARSPTARTPWQAYHGPGAGARRRGASDVASTGGDAVAARVAAASPAAAQEVASLVSALARGGWNGGERGAPSEPPCWSVTAAAVGGPVVPASAAAPPASPARAASHAAAKQWSHGSVVVRPAGRGAELSARLAAQPEGEGGAEGLAVAAGARVSVELRVRNGSHASLGGVLHASFAGGALRAAPGAPLLRSDGSVCLAADADGVSLAPAEVSAPATNDPSTVVGFCVPPLPPGALFTVRAWLLAPPADLFANGAAAGPGAGAPAPLPLVLRYAGATLPPYAAPDAPSAYALPVSAPPAAAAPLPWLAAPNSVSHALAARVPVAVIAALVATATPIVDPTRGLVALGEPSASSAAALGALPPTALWPAPVWGGAARGADPSGAAAEPPAPPPPPRSFASLRISAAAPPPPGSAPPLSVSLRCSDAAAWQPVPAPAPAAAASDALPAWLAGLLDAPPPPPGAPAAVLDSARLPPGGTLSAPIILEGGAAPARAATLSWAPATSTQPAAPAPWTSVWVPAPAAAPAAVACDIDVPLASPDTAAPAAVAAASITLHNAGAAFEALSVAGGGGGGGASAPPASTRAELLPGRSLFVALPAVAPEQGAAGGGGVRVAPLTLLVPQNAPPTGGTAAPPRDSVPPAPPPGAAAAPGPPARRVSATSGAAAALAAAAAVPPPRSAAAPPTTTTAAAAVAPAASASLRPLPPALRPGAGAALGGGGKAGHATSQPPQQQWVAAPAGALSWGGRAV